MSLSSSPPPRPPAQTRVHRGTITIVEDTPWQRYSRNAGLENIAYELIGGDRDDGPLFRCKGCNRTGPPKPLRLKTIMQHWRTDCHPKARTMAATPEFVCFGCNERRGFDAMLRHFPKCDALHAEMARAAHETSDRARTMADEALRRLREPSAHARERSHSPSPSPPPPASLSLTTSATAAAAAGRPPIAATRSRRASSVASAESDAVDAALERMHAQAVRRIKRIATSSGYSTEPVDKGYPDGVDTPGAVCYALFNPNDPVRVKIGHTSNIFTLLTSAQRFLPNLVVITLVDCHRNALLAYQIEQFLHVLFREDRESGEWFRTDAHSVQTAAFMLAHWLHEQGMTALPVASHTRAIGAIGSVTIRAMSDAVAARMRGTSAAPVATHTDASAADDTDSSLSRASSPAPCDPSAPVQDGTGDDSSGSVGEHPSPAHVSVDASSDESSVCDLLYGTGLGLQVPTPESERERREQRARDTATVQSLSRLVEALAAASSAPRAPITALPARFPLGGHTPPSSPLSSASALSASSSSSSSASVSPPATPPHSPVDSPSPSGD